MHPTAPHESSSTAPGAASTRRRRKNARPSELLAAGLELFVDRGFAATRLDDVARRAGVSKGTLYLYFPSKEALFKAVIEDGMVAALLAAGERMAAHQGPAAELLHELLLGWWQQIGSTALAGVSKLIISEARNFPEIADYYRERVISRGRALLRQALERGIDQGEFRPLHVEAAIDVIIAPLLMLAISRFSLRLCGHEVSPEDYLETHFELLLRGLRPAGDRP